MMFFSNNQDEDYSYDNIEFSGNKFNNIEFSGRKFNELCESRNEIISELDRIKEKGIITSDEYDYWCDKLYDFNFNNKTITNCRIFICSKI